MVTIKDCDDNNCDVTVYKKNSRHVYTNTSMKYVNTQILPVITHSSNTIANLNTHT